VLMRRAAAGVVRGGAGAGGAAGGARGGAGGGAGPVRTAGALGRARRHGACAWQGTRMSSSFLAASRENGSPDFFTAKG
jgi:hypothetical protein